MRRRIGLVLLMLGVLSPLRADEAGNVVVCGESRPAATRLDEAAKRIKEGKLGEGVALLQSVIETNANDLVVLPAGRSVNARHLAQAALARLDARGLELYRRKLEPQAEKALEAGRKGNAAELRRVADEMFCTRSALFALSRLGDLAFERGRFAEAEHWWQLIAPLQPIKLADADPETLVYPDAPEPVAARARAKVLLGRLFARAPNWKADLDAFRKRHPGASGDLAGRTGPYADTLEAVAAARANLPAAMTEEWPTFGGSASRGRVVAGPDRLLDRLSQLCRNGPTWRFDLERRARQEAPHAAPERGQEVEAARRLAFHPVVVGSQALVADARFVTAYDLRTGKAATWYDAARFVGGIDPSLDLPAPLDLRYTLTAAEGCVYARLGTQAVKDVRPDPRPGGRPGGAVRDNTESILVCLSLTPGKEGDRRRWMVRAIDPGRKEHAVFEGAPLVHEGRVYIAATRFEGDRVITAVRCYPAHPEDAAPAPLWRTDVCETRELLPAGGDRVRARQERNRHHLLTLAGSRVVYCSHSGAIAAVDATTGRRAWGVKYPRRDLREPEDEPALRDLAPCLSAGGKLFAAPADSERLLCLDSQTGAARWQRDRLDVVHLLGVGQGKLIFTTWRNPREGVLHAGGLRAVGADDGSVAEGWSLPDDGGGLAPFGRGLLIDDLVLWPTARKPYGVFAVRQSDGVQPDNPSLLHRIPSGNLVYANGCLLVADQRTLHAFVPPELLAGEDDRDRAAQEKRPRKATEDQPPRARLAALVRMGAWEQVRKDADLRDLCIEDEHGLPQSASIVASAAKTRETSPRAPAAQAAEAVPVLPLRMRCEVTLGREERFLPPEKGEGPAGAFIWSARDAALICRDSQTGAVKWQQSLPFDPQWLAGLGTSVVACGPQGTAALRASDGARLWTFLAPPLGRYPSTSSGAVRVVRDVLPPEPLAGFHLASGRLFFLQGERRLLALDARTGRTLWQRWAPGSAFRMPAPRGRFQVVLPINDITLLVQASARRWLLDVATGKVRSELPAPLERWPRAPLVLQDGTVALVPDARAVELLDPATGKARWRWALPGSTTRSGEPPLVLGTAQALYVVVPENYGYRLQRLAPATGMALWSRPPLVELARLDPGAWLAGPRALYHADAGELTARSLVDGTVLWQRKLDGAWPWRLDRAGDTLLAWPAGAPASQFRFRWLLGSVQWQAGPLPGAAGASLSLLEAQTGTLVQRINLEDVSPRLSRRLEARRESVSPSLSLDRVASAAAGIILWRDGKELLVGLGNRVKALHESRE
jgi:outer membrane protein assembly factor BamB